MRFVTNRLRDWETGSSKQKKSADSPSLLSRIRTRFIYGNCLQRMGKRTREGGAEERVSKKAKHRGAAPPQSSLHHHTLQVPFRSLPSLVLRERAIDRPNGALRSLLLVNGGSGAGRQQGRSAERQPAHSKTAPHRIPRSSHSAPSRARNESGAPSAVGIVGTRLFGTPDKAVGEEGERVGVGGKGRSAKKVLADVEQAHTKEERRWCVAFFVLLPVLVMWIMWLAQVL